jgi:hypothetical protein
VGQLAILTLHSTARARAFYGDESVADAMLEEAEPAREN